MKRLAALSWVLLLLTAAGPARAAGSSLRPLDQAQLAAFLAEPAPARLVFFMASWCAPCRQELPVLQRLWLKYKDRGLDLAGISLDLEPEAMQGLLDRAGVSFPTYWAGEEPIQRYGLFGIPLLLVLRQGREAERMAGVKAEEFLEARIVESLRAAGR